ncbi:hypothetical protein LAZ67_18001168 [Cordylochernes scorpioides]|uniref:G-protein coupled receptors family 1 profile domain-containing protein n=1 Tax=Cordylochernes scorpioides TaxID=51811 RepID=A0ABY6LJA2_9ARAC|nr:hypothetical protein LAZ67_18001168 [Cordylochernes scorpioides]
METMEEAQDGFNSMFIYFAVVCIFIVIVVGAVGNMVTIIALLKCPKTRTATTAFIINLSLVDFIFCVLCLPFSASIYLNHSWVHGDALCILFPLLRYSNVGLSVLSIVAITINRYIFIAHPALYSTVYSRKSHVAAMIAGIWLFSFSLMIPPLTGKWGKFGFDPDIISCTILEVNGRSPKQFLFLLGFLLPALAIVLCYLRIFWVIYQSRSRLNSYGSPGNQGFSIRPSEWRLTRTVLIIFCSFLFCYLPITIIKQVANRKQLYAEIHVLGNLLLYLGACINPVLYGATNPLYRKAYRNLLPCLRSDPPTSSTSHSAENKV